ncbi:MULTISPECIES: hypothetical protein [Acinetobacter]|uniref:Uncharacterized protein n=2 Tax=Acinetobacter TaxID=469 RepID=N9DFR3_9GAMM|nr:MULTISPECIES: hypothetical protein [Acinetobacter]ENV79590.1 hypothetical protein F942_01780 [Acinetobacter ursingii ANC 3649]QXZ23201.1 hypothetical protein I6L31_16295 [Acinetobacter septicus]QXZ23248.1 hypothetical protein I6L31_00085 [Acinetobacter septicus]
MILPEQLLEKFLVFNCNAGFAVKGTSKGLQLSRKNQKSLFISHKGEMNKEAQERYQLMLKLWFRDGRKFMDDLNTEVRRIYRMVARWLI